MRGPASSWSASAQAIDHDADDRLRITLGIARDGALDVRQVGAELQREREDHGGIAGDGLDLFAALAAVDEDFADRAVVIESNRDGVRASEPAEVEIERLAGATLWQHTANGHGSPSLVCGGAILSLSAFDPVRVTPWPQTS